MNTKTHYTNDSYQCPKTNNLESVKIEHTTKQLKSSRTAQRQTHSFTRKNLYDCSGLEECGVKITHGRGSTFEWKLCPLIPTLNTGK